MAHQAIQTTEVGKFEGLFEDPYIQSYCEENFTESNEECAGCGGKLLKNTGQEWLDERCCPACRIFWQGEEQKDTFDKPRQRRRMVPL